MRPWQEAAKIRARRGKILTQALAEPSPRSLRHPEWLHLPGLSCQPCAGRHRGLAAGGNVSPAPGQMGDPGSAALEEHVKASLQAFSPLPTFDTTPADAGIFEVLRAAWRMMHARPL